MGMDGQLSAGPSSPHPGNQAAQTHTPHVDRWGRNSTPQSAPDTCWQQRSTGRAVNTATCWALWILGRGWDWRSQLYHFTRPSATLLVRLADSRQGSRALTAPHPASFRLTAARWGTGSGPTRPQQHYLMGKSECYWHLLGGSVKDLLPTWLPPGRGLWWETNSPQRITCFRLQDMESWRLALLSSQGRGHYFVGIGLLWGGSYEKVFCSVRLPPSQSFS